MWIYPAVLIMGYILGTSYFPPKTTGIFLTPHVLKDDSIRFRASDSGLDSFHQLIARLYGDSVVRGTSKWIDNEILNSSGLRVQDGFVSEGCTEDELIRLKKDAVASIWYSPNSFLKTEPPTDNEETGSEADHHSPNQFPVTILFLPDHQNVRQIDLLHCDHYLIFIPNREDP